MMTPREESVLLSLWFYISLAHHCFPGGKMLGYKKLWFENGERPGNLSSRVSLLMLLKRREPECRGRSEGLWVGSAKGRIPTDVKEGDICWEMELNSASHRARILPILQLSHIKLTWQWEWQKPTLKISIWQYTFPAFHVMTKPIKPAELIQIILVLSEPLVTILEIQANSEIWFQLLIRFLWSSFLCPTSTPSHFLSTSSIIFFISTALNYESEVLDNLIC